MNIFNKVADKVTGKNEEQEEENNENAEKEAQQKEIESQTYDYNNLKEGEYSIHVYLEETRNLVNENNEKALDPLIKVEAFGQTRLTKVKKNRGIGMIYWGEHFFFNKSVKNSQEMEAEKLKISVMNHGVILRDSLVGTTEMDALSIYFSEEHAIQHRWVILVNMNKDYEQIMGFLKFSVQVYAKGDKQIVLKDEELKAVSKLNDIGLNGAENHGDSDQFAFGKAELILPPQIKTQGHYLKITLIRAEHLPSDMDTVGTIDPFIIFEFGTSRYKTKPIKNNPNPTWNQVIFIPYSEPMISNTLKLKVYDYDFGRADEIVGSFYLQKKDIVQSVYRTHSWFNIYGSQKGSSQAKKREIMNSCPDLATWWKGRIMMKLETELAEKPQQKVEACPDKDIQLYYQRNNSLKWQINADIYYGVEFKEKGDKYHILIRWADQEIEFPQQKQDKGVWKWNQFLTKQFDLPYLNSRELPDVFVYLVQNGRKVCYIRKTYQYFNQMINKEPFLFHFTPDMAKAPKMRQDEAGMIKMKIVVGDVDFLKNNNYVHANVTESPSQGNIICNIFHCQNLIPGDDSGKSDPYLKINYYGKEVETVVIEDSLNPVYNQKLILQDVPIFNMDKNPPPLTIRVFDKDFLVPDDFLGVAVVDLKDMLANNQLVLNKLDREPKPKWIDFEYAGQKECGRVLISFVVLNQNSEIIQNQLKQIPRLIELKTEKYHIKLRILGLRDLQSLGLLPVKNAFLKFDINSLLPNTKKQALSEKKALVTQPKESGSNPNICTILSFDIDLPIDLIYIPHMSVLCYDRIMKGFIQPILGTFSIDLAKYIAKTKKFYYKKIKKATEFFLSTDKQH